MSDAQRHRRGERPHRRAFSTLLPKDICSLELLATSGVAACVVVEIGIPENAQSLSLLSALLHKDICSFELLAASS